MMFKRKNDDDDDEDKVIQKVVIKMLQTYVFINCWSGLSDPQGTLSLTNYDTML
jgi:hypothetical protein